MTKHCHVYVGYQDSEGEEVDSMSGFDPTNPTDRRLVHDMLDEYLLKYLVPRFRGEERAATLDHRFIVSNVIHEG